MKKLVILLFFLVAVLSTKYFASHKNGQSTLLLYNVEALAADEHAAITHCYGSGTLDCPISHKKVEFIAGGYSLEEFN